MSKESHCTMVRRKGGTRGDDSHGRLGNSHGFRQYTGAQLKNSGFIFHLSWLSTKTFISLVSIERDPAQHLNRLWSYTLERTASVVLLSAG